MIAQTSLIATSTFSAGRTSAYPVCSSFEAPNPGRTLFFFWISIASDDDFVLIVKTRFGFIANITRQIREIMILMAAKKKKKSTLA